MPRGSEEMPDLKHRSARQSISDLFACASASIALLKEKRMSKVQSRDKIEGMTSRNIVC